MSLNGLEEPAWIKVLETIYDEDIYWEDDADIDSDHPVVSALDDDPEEVQNHLAFLSQVELIGHVKAGMTADVPRPGKESMMPVSDVDRRQGLYMGLTPRGFSVVHQRRMQERQDSREDNRLERQENLENKRAKRQHEINRAIAFLTLGLMVVTVIDSAVRAFVGKGAYDHAFQTVFAGLVLVIVFAVILNLSGLLSSLEIELD